MSEYQCPSTSPDYKHYTKKHQCSFYAGHPRIGVQWPDAGPADDEWWDHCFAPSGEYWNEV